MLELASCLSDAGEDIWSRTLDNWTAGLDISDFSRDGFVSHLRRTKNHLAEWVP